MIVAIVLGIIIGALIAYIAMNALIRVPQPVDGSIAEENLKTTIVGTYRYNGSTYSISAYDAIVSTESLGTARRSDGTYETPSADMILSYARNEILNRLVIDNGIIVSDEQVRQYAYQITGSTDFDAIAAYYSMDATQAWDIMSRAAAVKALRDAVVSSSGNAPEQPAYPADGNTEVGNAEYANYIIGLLGNNWSSATGTWANTNNQYYNALKDMVFAPGSANYEAAQVAYSVAYQEYVDGGSQMQQWTDYVNGYLDEGSITIATLRA